MNSVTFSRSKIFLLIVFLVLVWQAVRFIPWLQPLQEADVDHGPERSGVVKPVLVSVFYEALCSDSKNFIVRQLLPTVKNAGRLINVSLVPYGKAKTEENISGNISFMCQHGPTECLANKIHACAISKVQNSFLQVKYVACMISDNMVPELVGEKCAKDLGIEWQSISQCAFSEQGNKLLKKFGELTDELVPKIAFVPTILIDNKLKPQAPILKNFFKELCNSFKELPEECASAY